MHSLLSYHSLPQRRKSGNIEIRQKLLSYGDDERSRRLFSYDEEMNERSARRRTRSRTYLLVVVRRRSRRDEKRKGGRRKLPRHERFQLLSL